MGSFLCRTSESSEINLSENCIKRITEERTLHEQDLYLNVPQEDDHWMKKLRCMDEAHSKNYGLTTHAFMRLIENMERRISLDDSKKCSTDKLIRCLKENSHCSIRCKKVLDEFIDCVDSKRIGIIKQRKAADYKLKESAKKEKLVKEIKEIMM